jgi:peroxiredoxin/outer membrane lipoprotein-sorting protein
MTQFCYFRATVCSALLSLFTMTAAEQNAKDVLARMTDAYSHVSALHVVAKREEAWFKNGQSRAGNTELEIARLGSRKYFARSKSDGTESLAVSDGQHTWKAIPSKKQWTQLAAAAVETGEFDGPDPRGRDLNSSLTMTLAGRYIALAKLAENPTIAGEEDLKVAGQKIPCYVIRARTGAFEHELWVDKQRFVVLQHKEKGDLDGMHGEIHMKVSVLELNPSLPDATFQFEPGKGWSEAEMLLLPGEERMMLTGSRAANFALKTLGGDSVELEGARGKVVVLDFWATWCPPCREELPSIEKLRQEFAQVQFYGINDEDSSTVKGFLKKNGYELSVLMDGKRQVHRQYGVSSIPTLLIIDKQGVIREHFIGSRSEGKLRQALQAAVAAN